MLEFHFTHNWSKPVVVRHAFKTAVIRSESGREQRIANRFNPRLYFEYDAVFTAEKAIRFTPSYIRGHREPVKFPDFTEFVKTSSSASTGASSVTYTGAAPYWLVAGGDVYIVSGSNSQYLEILSVVGATVTFTSTLEFGISSGSKVYLARSGVMNSASSYTQLTSTVSSGSLSFSAFPDSPVMSDASPSTHNGKDLFMTKPNWKPSPGATVDSDLLITDFGTGSLSVFDRTNMAIQRHKHNYAFFDRDSITDFVKFFYRQKGRRGEFYAPTWTQDFPVDTSASAGQNVVTIPGRYYYDALLSSKTHKAVGAFFKDGTYQLNRISSISLVSGNSRIVFASNWAQTISNDNVKLLSFVNCWRNSSDEMVVEWLTDARSLVSNVREVVEDV